MRSLASIGFALLALVACDAQKIVKLEPGEATEADVRKEWGTPAATYEETGGNTVLEYPRQPEGQVNYAITIGADGKLVKVSQVLKESNFVKVVNGMGPEEVRRILGKPAKMQKFELKNEEVWDWRYDDNGEAKVFSATFDADRKVSATARGVDAKRTTAP